LADLQPDLVEVTTTPATVAVLQQTATVPMVFGIVLDALNSGFVEIRSARCNAFVSIEASSWAADCTSP
jgi:ABC-type uncharacterized transport system substrate-binding protein